MAQSLPGALTDRVSRNSVSSSYCAQDNALVRVYPPPLACADMIGATGGQATCTTTTMINAAPEPLLTPPATLPTELKPAASPSIIVRLCPALSKGSVWGTVINMCAAIMGAGCLSLPQAVASLGVVPFGVLILFTAVATHYSIVLLIAAIDATGCRSFEDMSALVIGTWTGHAVELAIIVFQYGTLVAYTIAVGDVLSPILRIDAVKDAMPWLNRELVQVIFWACLMLPLSFVENISSLQITSLLGQLSLLYLVLAVTVHSLIDTAAAPEATFGSLALAGPALGPASSASAVIMFAFTCQVNIPSLYDELQTRTPDSMRAVSLRACAICVLCYVLIGVFGYANFPHTTQGNILNNYCLLDPHKSAQAEDPPRVILPAFGCLTLTVLMAYPINIFPTRYAIEVMCYPKAWLLEAQGAADEMDGAAERGAGMSGWAKARHVALTLAIASLTLLTALALPSIDTVFALMGGTCSAFVCYIIPSAVAWRLADRVPQNRTLVGRLAVVGLGAFGTIVGVLSTTTTIIDLFKHDNSTYDSCDPPLPL